MSLPNLLSLIRKLPPTPFRTGATQLSDALEAIVGRSFGKRVNGLTAGEEAVVKSAEGSVRRIEEGAARREFPVSETLLHPAHDPHYYTRMRDGVHLSQKGIGRSWWKRFFQVKSSI